MKNETPNKQESSNNGLFPGNLSVNWETKEFPLPQSIDNECNDYYLVKVKGYTPVMAMYMRDKTGNVGWYTNYFSKIIEEVEAWARIE